jgi:two-component system, LuxR family, sensor kinase FixL
VACPPIGTSGWAVWCDAQSTSGVWSGHEQTDFGISARVLLEPVRSADGTIVGFAKVSHDVSTRREADRRLADTLRELDAVLNTMVDGLITFDDRCIVRSFTPSAERIFGYRATEMAGRNVNLLMPAPCDADEDDYLSSDVEKVISIGREVTARRKDGTLFPMELGISPYECGAP